MGLKDGDEFTISYLVEKDSKRDLDRHDLGVFESIPPGKDMPSAQLVNRLDALRWR